MHKKIAFFEIAAWEKEWLIKNLTGFELKFYSGPLDENRIPPERHFNAISVGTESALTHEVLEAFPHLELIAVRGRPCENIDLAACRKRKIMVCRIPSYAVHAVAEFTFALMLELTRKTCQVLSHAKNAAGASGDYPRGMDLWGKTLGIFGTGSIGSEVIRIAKGFGMKVIAWNPKQNLQLASDLGFTYMPFLSVLAYADILTIHLSYVEHGAGRTKGIFNREALAQVKHGALFINTAHPAIADSDALCWALNEHALAGAAVDADLRALTEDLRKHDRLLITPRIAFNTQETHERVLRETCENIRAYFSGFPKHVIGEKVS